MGQPIGRYAMNTAMNKVLMAAVLVVLLVTGCGRPKGVVRSAFFWGVDLTATVNRCAPAEVKWGDRGTGSGGGASNEVQTHWHKDVNADFQCGAEAVDTFLLALEADLQKAVESYGGKVAKPQNITAKPSVGGFGFDYEIGKTRGEVRGSVRRRNENEGRWTDRYPYHLDLRVEEAVVR